MIDGRKIKCIDNICTYRILVYNIHVFHQPRPAESENGEVVIFIATVAMFRSDPGIDWSLQHHGLSGTDSVTDQPKRKQSKFVEKSFYICRKPGTVRKHLMIQSTPHCHAHTTGARGMNN